MRVLLLTNAQPNQVALAHKLNDAGLLAGIVISNRRPKRQGSAARLKKTLHVLAERLLFQGMFSRSWKTMQSGYLERFGAMPAVSVVTASSINSDATIDAAKAVAADLVAVSGTELLTDETIRRLENLAPSGIVNLHTGLSPYVRGGPNCTNWCFSLGKPELVGNTVMYIDPGVDTGNLLATERTGFEPTDDFAEIHFKVMEHAHRLYLGVISRLSEGAAVQAVRQTELVGEDDQMEFRNRDWDLIAMAKAWWYYNLKLRKDWSAAQDRSLAVKLKKI